jgi:alpha-L-arabinofuranosidase
VEVFCPWGWHDSWWEVLHLFSRYAGSVRVEAVSNDENMVSAYASANGAGDAVTVVFVNRHKDQARPVHVTLAGFAPREGQHRTLSLHDLPDGQATFKSDKENALHEGTVEVEANSFALVLPPYSITAVLLEAQPAPGATGAATAP